MRYLCLLAFTSLFAITSVSAKESLFDQLSVAKTDFKITLNDIAIQVERQGITLRAASEKFTHKVRPEGTQTNDIAYRAYHLEFAFKQKYRIYDAFEVIEFYEGNDLLHQFSLKVPNPKLSKATGGRLYETNFITINLEGVPLIMLDSVDRINFRKSR